MRWDLNVPQRWTIETSGRRVGPLWSAQGSHGYLKSGCQRCANSWRL